MTFQGGGSSPWLSEFETFLSKLDRENLARATMPKPQPQPPQPQLPGNKYCQAERSLAWRIPLLRFIIEARTVLNVATSDERVKQRMLL